VQPGTPPAAIKTEPRAITSSLISPPAQPIWTRHRLLWGAAALVATVLAIGAVAGLFSRSQDSLAVMPLRVLGQGETDAGYLGVGIADAITTRLADTREIAVRPTSAVIPFTDAQSNTTQVLTSLGVRHLLVGTIQPLPGNYRISLQLVRSNGFVEWTRTFDEPATGLLELQDRIADDVAAALRLRLRPPERRRIRVQDTTNVVAYDSYLRGRVLLFNYTDEGKMRQAIRYFEDAVKIDPNFVRARVGIATACAWISVRYAHEPEALGWAKRADTEARAALAKDDSLAEAQLAIANAAGTEYGGFNWSIVLDRTAAALALNPSLELAHVARMRAYYHLGLFDQAREAGQRALQVNPSPTVEYQRLAVALELFTGRYQSAVDKARDLARSVDMPAVPQYLGLALFYVDDGQGARQMLGSIMRGATPDARAQASLSSIEAALGMRNQARERIAAIERGPDMDHHIAYSLGAAMAQLGDASGSLTWLEQAADTGFPCYPWFEKDPLLDPIRREPGFIRLMERLRVAHHEALRRAS
jgi:serine/threonine-protein kinase